MHSIDGAKTFLYFSNYKVSTLHQLLLNISVHFYRTNFDLLNMPLGRYFAKAVSSVTFFIKTWNNINEIPIVLI